MNSKRVGDMGLGAAIAHYTSQGVTVSVPLTDSQGYDLVVEKETKLYKVQVKTCSFVRNNSFTVSLTVKGGNRSGKSRIKVPTAHDFDLLFVVCSNGDVYEIPQNIVNEQRTISLGKAYAGYKIGM